MGAVLAVLEGSEEEGILGGGAVQVEVGGGCAIGGSSRRQGEGGEGKGRPMVAFPEPDEGFPALEVGDEGDAGAVAVTAQVRISKEK